MADLAITNLTNSITSINATDYLVVDDTSATETKSILGANLWTNESGAMNIKNLGSGDMTIQNVGDGYNMFFKCDNASNVTKTHIELDPDTNQTKVSGFFNIPSAGTLTIASDAITVTGSHHLIDTEGAAATDNLSTINGGNDGDILFLQTVNSARDVVIKNGTGNIACTADKTHAASTNLSFFRKQGSTWIMISFN